MTLGRGRVLERLVDSSVLVHPLGARRRMRADVAGSRRESSRSRSSPQQMVVAEPPAAVVERNQEAVRPLDSRGFAPTNPSGRAPCRTARR